MLHDKDKVEPANTITVKEERDYGETGGQEQEMANMKQELERLSERISKVEHHKHHHHDKHHN